MALRMRLHARPISVALRCLQYILADRITIDHPSSCTHLSARCCLIPSTLPISFEISIYREFSLHAVHGRRLSLVSLLGRCAAWCIGTAPHVFAQLVVLRQSSSIVTAALSRRQHVFLSEALKLSCHTIKFRIRPCKRPEVGSTAPTQPV